MKSALFAAAVVMIVLVALLFGVLQHRVRLHWNRRRHPREGNPYRPPRLQSLRKLFWAVCDSVAVWLAEEGCYRIPQQETNPHPSVMV